MRSVPHLQTEMLDRFKGQRDFGRIKVKINPKYLRKINEGAVGVNVLRKDDTVVGVGWWMEGTTKVFNIFVGFCNNPKVDDCRAIRQAHRSIDKQETRTRGVGELIAVKEIVKELCEQIVSVMTTPFAIMIHSNGEPQRIMRLAGIVTANPFLTTDQLTF